MTLSIDFDKYSICTQITYINDNFKIYVQIFYNLKKLKAILNKFRFEWFFMCNDLSLF